MSKILIGISACLLGEKVRFDGGHKNDKYLATKLSEYFEYVRFCPEVAIGLGVPRSTLRLVRHEDGRVRAIMPKTQEDYTDALDDFAQQTVNRIQSISGYILKSKSPSCGMARVKVYDEEGNAQPSDEVGIFAKRLMASLPNLPIEEEGRLNDAHLREGFVKRVYAYKDWQETVEADLTHPNLIAFHTRHKLMLILHHYGNSKTLGRIVAETTPENIAENAKQYIALFMQTLKKLPAKRHHGQVLTRIVTNINKALDDEY